MSENERKAVHELSDNELRLEIALATKSVRSCYPIRHISSGDITWHATLDNGEFALGLTAGGVLDELGVTNWPGDIGAAFELADSVALNLWRANGYLVTRRLLDGFLVAYYSVFPGARDKPFKGLIAKNKSDARALSELAALALRGLAVSDE